MKIRLLSLLVCLAVWCSELDAAPSLIADVITVTEDGNTIVAKGNVEVTYNNSKFKIILKIFTLTLIMFYK